MRLEIRRRRVEVTEELRAHLVERLRLALGRFRRYIGEVRVYLRDVNGPRGGASKVCRVVVEVPRDGRVVVTGADAEIAVAITRTASRAGFAVRRCVKRRLARRRRPRRPGRRLPPVPAGAPGKAGDVWQHQGEGAIHAAR
jgi:putative sigma-54 modulation protein